MAVCGHTNFRRALARPIRTPPIVKITENGFTNGWLFRFVGHYIFHEDTQIKKYESDLQKSIGK